MPGQHNNCGKRLPLDNRRSISFAIVIPNLDPVSLAWQQRAASRYSKRPITHHGPMPSVNGLWAACGESVSIIFSSSMRSSCIMFCVPMSSTLIEPDRIKASDNRSQHSLGRQFLRMTAGERSSACQSWVDYTTITAEVLSSSLNVEKRVATWWGVCLIWKVADWQVSL